MKSEYIQELFSLSGKVAAITGAGGVLCSEMARGLGRLGVKVAVLDLSLTAAQRVTEEIKAEGGDALAVQCNVLDKQSIEDAAKTVKDTFGRIDILINGAGGNKKEATTTSDLKFFDIPADAIQWVFNLNLIGTVVPSQVFGKYMIENGEGCILNISSMNAFRPLTRIPAYSAAKAAVSNFTQWLAVHVAQEYSPRIRVNAIAPGFFITEQNRLLVTRPEGGYTPRGEAIVAHTPMCRFGVPADLLGSIIWLLSPSASFVTGVVIPIDGGFSAFSGV